MKLRNRIVLILNIFVDDQGCLPEGVKEVMFHVDIAAKSSRHVEVSICYVIDVSQESEIRAQIAEMKINPDIILNLGQSQKLPMIGDILATALKICNDGDYICYINSDIICPYWFFDFLAGSIRTHSKATGFIINRKDVLDPNFDYYEDDGRQPIIYHPGYDCFLFPKDMLNSSFFGMCTVGLPPVGALLATNMLGNLSDVKLINDSVVTIHRGDGRQGTWQRRTEEIQNNYLSAFEAVDDLIADLRRRGVAKLKTLSLSRKFLEAYMKSRDMKLKGY